MFLDIMNICGFVCLETLLSIFCFTTPAPLVSERVRETSFPYSSGSYVPLDASYRSPRGEEGDGERCLELRDEDGNGDYEDDVCKLSLA